MLLHVYRLRQRGERLDRAGMAKEGVLGELRLEQVEARGSRSSSIAYLTLPGTPDEVLPRLLVARVRIRETIVLTGIEQVPHGRKGVDRYAQTWVCSPVPIPPERWPDPGAVRAVGAIQGFDPADDDDPP